MKIIAFTSVVLLHLLCYAEGSRLTPVSSAWDSVVPSSSACDSKGVALLSIIYVQVIETYIYVICNGLRVLEHAVALVGCISELLPYPLNQILQAVFNGVIIGSEKLTDVCAASLGSISGYVKGKCPKMNLFSVKNNVLSPPLIKGPTEACGTIYDPIVATFACTIIELVSISTELLCVANELGMAIAELLACLTTILPPPLDCFVSSIFSELADGATALAVVGWSVVKKWNADVNAICPCSCANVGNAVSLISSQIKFLDVSKNKLLNF